MAKGRKPEPGAIKAAKGNPGRRPIAADPAATAAPGGRAAGIAPPSWLDGEALKVWQLHAPVMQQLKLLGDADVNAFARYCQNVASWIAARRDLLERGMTYEVESAHGKYIRKNPSFDQMHALENDLVRIEDRFGMNPAERQRIFASRAAGTTASAGSLPLEGGKVNAPAGLSDELEAEPAAPQRGPIGLLN